MALKSTIRVDPITMEKQMDWDPPILWKPQERHGKLLKKLMKVIEEKYGDHFDDYFDLHKWSVENSNKFWGIMWDFTGMVYSKRFEKVIDTSLPISMQPKWFEGARLNYGENLLRHRTDKPALIAASEDSEPITITYNQLFTQSEIYAAAFRKFGLKKGDIVACFMSNRLEAFYFHIAAASIGAIWTGCLPLIGAKAALSKFKQVSPKVLVTVDRFLFQGKEVEMLPKVQEIVKGLPSLEKVIIARSRSESPSPDISAIGKSCFVEEFLETGKNPDGSVPPMKFEQLSFSHPVSICFTSGTTGTPKMLLHGCGTIQAIYIALVLTGDTDSDSVWLSISPAGWASWNAFAAVLHTGCTLVLFEGNPYALSPTYFYELLAKFKVTHTYIPASAIDEYQKRNFVPTSEQDLSSLKLIFGAGSIVKPQNYDFMYRNFKNVFCANLYGSTEVMGAALVFVTALPIRRGELQAPGLGVSIEIIDEEGNPVSGDAGEVFISKPVPTLPIGLMGDEDGKMFREKYCPKYSDKFAICDVGIHNPKTKGFIICGRSDETIKQRGCRFGSSEIYKIVETIPEVHNSICVSQYNKTLDERAVLFLQISEGHRFSKELEEKIRKTIATELTSRHVPDIILEINEIPYNMNGKKTESLVKKIINRMPYDTETISNPQCLKDYENRKELEGF